MDSFWNGRTGNRKLKQLRRHKFAYLTMKNSDFVPFAGAFFIFAYFAAASFFPRRKMTCFAVVWTCFEVVCTWRQIVSLLFPSLSRLHQFNSRIASKHFARQTTWNNRGMIREFQTTLSLWPTFSCKLVITRTLVRMCPSWHSLFNERLKQSVPIDHLASQILENITAFWIEYAHGLSKMMPLWKTKNSS